MADSKQLNIESLPRDRRAERYVLAIIFRCSDTKLLGEVDVEDFHDPDHKFLFKELRLMQEAGYPLEDAAACARWFSNPATKRRAEEDGMKDSLAALTASVFGEYVTSANTKFYVDVLRKERLRRKLAWVAITLGEKNEAAPDEPVRILEWLQGMVDQLWQTAYASFPAEFETE